MNCDGSLWATEVPGASRTVFAPGSILTVLALGSILTVGVLVTITSAGRASAAGAISTAHEPARTPGKFRFRMDRTLPVPLVGRSVRIRSRRHERDREFHVHPATARRGAARDARAA